MILTGKSKEDFINSKVIGVDYDKVKKKENWFSDYFLAQDKQDEIMENILRGKKLTKIKKNAIKSTVLAW